MDRWKQVLQQGWIAGSMASVLSALALLVAGRRENDHAAAPINAISHWMWDRPALHKDAPSLRHTLVGYIVHHCASVFWGVLHASTWGRATQSGPALAAALSTTAAACWVDYRMTPERLTPGFEHRLSRNSMALVYACFALGLAVGSLWSGSRLRSGACSKIDDRDITANVACLRAHPTADAKN